MDENLPGESERREGEERGGGGGGRKEMEGGDAGRRGRKGEH